MTPNRKHSTRTRIVGALAGTAVGVAGVTWGAILAADLADGAGMPAGRARPVRGTRSPLARRPTARPTRS